MGNNANCRCVEKENEDSELLTENDSFLFSKRTKRNNKIKLSLFSLLRDKMLKSKEKYRKQIEDLVNEGMFNLGHSAEVGAKYIISAVQRKVKERRNK